MRHPHAVTLVTPSSGGTHAATGNPVSGPPASVDTRGLLQQRDAAEPGDGSGRTSDRWWLWLPVGTVITASTVVVCAAGRFEVVGRPVTHTDPAGRPRAVQADLNRLSDLQEAP